MSKITSKSRIERWLAACAVVALMFGAGAIKAAEGWEASLAKMPLVEKATILHETNCVPLTLHSFTADPTVKGLVWMPGATDEFWFFHRAKVTLTNASPTLLDVVIGLTNQTRIRAHFEPPLLLLYAADDPTNVWIEVQDEATASRIRKKKFYEHTFFYDKDWGHVQPKLAFQLNTFCKPPGPSSESYHFYRHSFAGWNLSGWEAMEAISLANQTRVTVQKKTLVFQADTRRLQKK